MLTCASSYFSVFSTFLYISLTDLALLFFVFFSTWNLFVCSSFRYKMFYFILNVVFFGIWGFLASFDGITLMMLTAELTVAVFFLFLFLTAKFKKENINVSKILWIFHLILILTVNLCVIKENTSTFYFFFQNIYPYTQDIVAHDLIIIFMFVLYLNPIVTIYLSITLGLFSIFFICIYFTIRTLRQFTNKSKIEPLTLRQQVVFSQGKYRAKVCTFKRS